MRAVNLQTLPAFNGLFIAKGADGKIDPDTQLFRTTWPGVTTGPVVSQFLLQNFTIDGITVESKQKTLIPDVNYMTAFEPWLDVQVSMRVSFGASVAGPLGLGQGVGLPLLGISPFAAENHKFALIIITHVLPVNRGGNRSIVGRTTNPCLLFMLYPNSVCLEYIYILRSIWQKPDKPIITPAKFSILPLPLSLKVDPTPPLCPHRTGSPK